MLRRCSSTLGRGIKIVQNGVREEQAKLFEQGCLGGINQIRNYSQETPRPKNIFTQPVTYASLGATAVVGGGMMYYYSQVKEERDKDVKKKGKGDEGVGTADIGAPFELVDQNGNAFKSEQLEGEFAMLYFGFTHCPDICPDELEKVSEAVEIIQDKTGHFVQPVMITCDPYRDTAPQMKQYVKEFHPKMIGLTGEPDVVKEVCRSYRVYFMKTDQVQDDYLVDHSIITYLVDPEGDFVTFFGKNFEPEQIAKSVGRSIRKWKKKHPDYVGNVVE
eukprot:TRINITY_DN17429_c0_g1_i1.p1 TRINITY_DN17429_c0_g1~~TRINITY_DN17429_c0_g1_i1.p1  ORF type:complete len:275 (-),score=45.74 TRINITY_DN17429_c0_g1_i1:163-987(-)